MVAWVWGYALGNIHVQGYIRFLSWNRPCVSTRAFPDRFWVGFFYSPDLPSEVKHAMISFVIVLYNAVAGLIPGTHRTLSSKTP